jgi:thioesterase domain-containing protein
MSSDETIQKCFEIIGEALSLEPDDFQDNETWKFLGLGDLLAKATASDLTNETGITILPSDFEKYESVGAFKNFLHTGGKSTTTTTTKDQTKPSNGNGNNTTNTDEPSDPWLGVPKPKVPLSVILQGKPTPTSTNIFLFPDGSGAGTSYGTLPPLGGNTCLIGLNSPFLRQAQDFTCSIERMARLWHREILKLQPAGPYILGGWSAGGYYSYEMVKLLTADGMVVKQLILIDSPCRLEFEALPAQVVDELTRKGLMGASGAKKAPEWLVQHFTSTVLSVERYMPTPMAKEHVPAKVSFVWVREGLVKSVAESGLEVDLNVKVTRFLLEPRPELKSAGWERLLPGAVYSFDYMTGNHFQITQAPHVSFLALLGVLFLVELHADLFVPYRLRVWAGYCRRSFLRDVLLHYCFDRRNECECMSSSTEPGYPANCDLGRNKEAFAHLPVFSDPHCRIDFSA